MGGQFALQPDELMVQSVGVKAARVTPTFHVEVVGCSWGYPGVLYSVWTQALR